MLKSPQHHEILLLRSFRVLHKPVIFKKMFSASSPHPLRHQGEQRRLTTAFRRAERLCISLFRRLVVHIFTKREKFRCGCFFLRKKILIVDA